MLRFRGMDFRVGQFGSYGRSQLRLRTVGFDFPGVLASVGVEMKSFQDHDGLPQAVLAVLESRRSSRVEHELEMGGQCAALLTGRKRIFSREFSGENQ